MTNTTIITNALKARGMTDDQLSQLLTAYNGDLPFHTIPEWSRRGYHIKTDAVPLFDCYLWKHTDKPSAAAIQAAQDAEEERLKALQDPVEPDGEPNDKALQGRF